MAGDTATASTQDQRAAALTTAVNAQLVETGGLYVDGLRADRSQSTHTSQLANATALAYGVVPAAAVAHVGAFVASLDISVEPDHGLELLRALHAAGRDPDVVRLLTDPAFPGWAAIIKAGGTFTWETWTPSDLIGDSMSHGWGSSALVAIQEVLLGAVPNAPPASGPSTLVTITPPSGGLRHASGSFPSPAGTFTVNWSTTSTGTQLSVTVPPNAMAHCRFTGATVSRVTDGGQSVLHAPGVTVLGSEGGLLTVAVGSGSYQFNAHAT